MNWYLTKQVGTTLAVYGAKNLLMCDLDDGAGSRPAIDGDVLSPQPNHSVRARPAGTNGAYEQCIVNGGTVAFNPTGKEPIVFGYQPTVPGGFGAISQEPLA